MNTPDYYILDEGPLMAVNLGVSLTNFAGIIYECGGKMHLSEESFQLAHTDFFEAFKCFDEAGSPRRISSLKYLGKPNF